MMTIEPWYGSGANGHQQLLPTGQPGRTVVMCSRELILNEG
jgi:hypothetical protein